MIEAVNITGNKEILDHRPFPLKGALVLPYILRKNLAFFPLITIIIAKEEQ